MAKKKQSKWFFAAKIVGYPIRKAFEAIVWASGKIIGQIVKTSVQKIEQEKRPKKGPEYSPFKVERTISGNFSNFESRLLDSKSSIGIILGARGTGKSGLGMRILENVSARKKRPVVAMGFSLESLPPWIKVVSQISQIQNGAFVLVDEGGILFSSREFMSDANKVLGELLLIARHKDLSVLFISQNSANLDINAIRQADFLLLRKSSLLQKDFERKKIAQVYLEAQKYFDENPNGKQKLTYVYSDEFRGFAINELPSFWSDKVSKGFSSFRPK